MSFLLILSADFLERVDVGFASANAHGLFNRRDENFAVADLSSPGGSGQLVHHLVELLAGDGDLKPQFGKEIHGVFGAAIDFSVPFCRP